MNNWNRKHYLAQIAVTLALTGLAAAECVLYGVPLMMAIPSIIVNYVWVWE